MEKIEAKISEIKAFLEEKEIEYRYIDYKPKKGENYEIQIICSVVSANTLTTLNQEYIYSFVYPFTQNHLVIKIDFYN